MIVRRLGEVVKNKWLSKNFLWRVLGWNQNIKKWFAVFEIQLINVEF